MSRVLSSLGVPQHYGERTTNEGLDNAIAEDGSVVTLRLPMTYTQVNAGLPTYNQEDDSSVNLIPAYSIIKEAYFHVTTAFTSGGSATLELGLQQDDGTAIDADGIDSIAVAALTANSWTVCDGALVGATIGANAGQISVDDATAVFTAGEGVLVVRYVPPTP